MLISVKNKAFGALTKRLIYGDGNATLDRVLAVSLNDPINFHFNA